MHAIEKALNYQFSNPEWITLICEHNEDNLALRQRLEFLGDALLSATISQWLYQTFPEANEGELTRLRSKLVNGECLCQLARSISLNTIIVSNQTINDSSLEMSMEVLFACILLDADMNTLMTVVKFIYQDKWNNLNLSNADKDYKTQLQEICQAKGISRPIYKIIGEAGPKHQTILTIETRVNDLGLHTVNKASNRKTAEQEAAKKLLDMIEKGNLS